jgi:hypothetical protein
LNESSSESLNTIVKGKSNASPASQTIPVGMLAGTLAGISVPLGDQIDVYY